MVNRVVEKKVQLASQRTRAQAGMRCAIAADDAHGPVFDRKPSQPTRHLFDLGKGWHDRALDRRVAVSGGVVDAAALEPAQKAEVVVQVVSNMRADGRRARKYRRAIRGRVQGTHHVCRLPEGVDVTLYESLQVAAAGSPARFFALDRGVSSDVGSKRR